MRRFEYKMLPAPTRAVKAKGVKSAEARFAHAVEATINDAAADGWEYMRADTLPHEERHGLTGSATTFRTLLVFRRAIAVDIPSLEEETPDLPSILKSDQEAEPDTAPDTEPQIEEALETPIETGSEPMTPEAAAATLQHDDEPPAR